MTSKVESHIEENTNGNSQLNSSRTSNLKKLLEITIQLARDKPDYPKSQIIVQASQTFKKEVS